MKSPIHTKRLFVACAAFTAAIAMVWFAGFVKINVSDNPGYERGHSLIQFERPALPSIPEIYSENLSEEDVKDETLRPRCNPVTVYSSDNQFGCYLISLAAHDQEVRSDQASSLVVFYHAWKIPSA
ncbi:MAG: hypothetical protein NZM13_10640 [Cyclobacteriaceae bacterium]|nr:hypothetical protein [Cyclobacteriaceae bacterium]